MKSLIQLVASTVCPVALLLSKPTAAQQPQRPPFKAMFERMAMPILAGPKIAMQELYAEGKVSQTTLQCMERLPASVYQSPMYEILSKVLTPEEIAEVSEFYLTDTGRKVLVMATVAQYKAKSLLQPEPDPVWNATDEKVAQAFAARPSGGKMLKGRPFSSQDGQRILSDTTKRVTQNCVLTGKSY